MVRTGRVSQASGTRRVALGPHPKTSIKVPPQPCAAPCLRMARYSWVVVSRKQVLERLYRSSVKGASTGDVRRTLRGRVLWALIAIGAPAVVAASLWQPVAGGLFAAGFLTLALACWLPVTLDVRVHEAWFREHDYPTRRSARRNR